MTKQLLLSILNNTFKVLVFEVSWPGTNPHRNAVLDPLSCAKITNFSIFVLGQEDVQSLDVSVQDALLGMQVLDTETNLDE